MFGLLSLFKGAKWYEEMETRMRVCIADTEYQIGWEKKLEGTDEKKVQLQEAVGDLIKYCLKLASQNFNLMNPTLKDIDNNTVYVKSITNHNITPIFVVSAQPDGVKTVISVTRIDKELSKSCPKQSLYRRAGSDHD